MAILKDLNSPELFPLVELGDIFKVYPYENRFLVCEEFVVDLSFCVVYDYDEFYVDGKFPIPAPTFCDYEYEDCRIVTVVGKLDMATKKIEYF